MLGSFSNKVKTMLLINMSKKDILKKKNLSKYKSIPENTNATKITKCKIEGKYIETKPIAKSTTK